MVTKYVFKFCQNIYFLSFYKERFLLREHSQRMVSTNRRKKTTRQNDNGTDLFQQQ